jgi:hypothetical protein
VAIQESLDSGSSDCYTVATATEFTNRGLAR